MTNRGEILPTGSGRNRDVANVRAHSNLTSSQLLIWTGQQITPDVPLYNMVLAFRIRGILDPIRFRNAWGRVAEHVDILRSVVAEVDGIPILRLSDDATPQLEMIRIPADAEPETFCKEFVTDRSQRIFNLSRQLTDSVLIQIAANDFFWYLNQHHLITDAASAAQLVREVSEAYRLQDAYPAVEIPQYSGYVEYERRHRSSKMLARASRHWQAMSTNPPPRPTLYGQEGSGTSTRTERVTLELSLERSAQLRDAARRMSQTALTEHIAVFNVFASLLGAFVSRVSDQDRIWIGAPAHNRPRSDFKRTIGPFIEVLPLEIRVSEQDTFRSLLETTGAETNSFLRYAQPGSSQAKHSRSYSARLNYIDASFPRFNDLPMTTEWVHSGHSDLVPAVQLQVHDFNATGQFVLHFDLNCDVFGSPEHRSDVVGHFERLLVGFLANPDGPIRAVSLLGREERRAVIRDSEGIRRARPSGTVLDRIRMMAETQPLSPAVIDGRRTTSYRELLSNADRISLELTRRGVDKGDRVGVLLERSVEAVAGVLGILGIGAAYVPLDPTDPAERTSLVLADAQVKAIVTSPREINALPVSGVEILPVHIDGVTEPRRFEQVADPKASDPAYVIYTSGSTGKPNGVVVPHGALANYIDWAAKYYADDLASSFPLYTSLSFDLTVTSLFVPLVTGGAVVVYRSAENEVDMSLMQVLDDDVVDFIKMTPSHLQLVQERRTGPRRLRGVIFGGENLRRDVAEATKRVLGKDIAVYNEYGPTECTVGCAIHRYDGVRDTGSSVPIGVPIENMRVYLLDPNLQPVPDGIVGSVYVAGAGISSGYFERPDLTSERFLKDPFVPGDTIYRTGDLARRIVKGPLVFLGRNDGQLKLRGFRIERGEVEAAVSRHTAVKDCVVSLANRGRNGDVLENDSDESENDESCRLIAYYAADSEVPSAELRSVVAAQLPSYMVPSSFVWVAEIPRSASGKADLEALAQLAADLKPGTSFVAPISTDEIALAEIWSRTLRVARVGVTDNFYDLGGDSLLAIQIAGKASRSGFHIKPTQILEGQTIASLIASNREKPGPTVNQELVTGEVPLAPIQRWFFGIARGNPHHWNNSLRLRGHNVDARLLSQTLAHLTRHHDALRHRFVCRNGTWTQFVTPPEDDIAVECFDLSPLPYEQQVAELDRVERKMHQSLRIDDGPVLRCCLAARGNDEYVIVLVVHHLVVDSYSWLVLVEDLNRCYEQMASGAPIRLPLKTSSYKTWAGLQGECATQDVRSVGVPVGDPPEKNEVRSGIERMFRIDLSREEMLGLTRALRSEAVPLEHALIGALAAAVADQTEESMVGIDVEGHGRNAQDKAVDLTRTVGWFTTLQPQLIDAGNGSSLGSLRRISEELARSKDAGVPKAAPQPHTHRGATQPLSGHNKILFNYLGKAVPDTTNGAFNVLGRLCLSRDPANEMPYDLEVNAAIVADQLVVDLTGHGRSLSVRRVGERFEVILKEIVGMVATAGPPATVRFDGVVEEDLKRIASLLERADGGAKG